MNQSNNQNASQMRFAYANANAQAQNEQANRYAATQAAQANREQSGMELGAQLQTQGNLAQAHIDAGRAQQVEGAVLSDWLNNRDMTQKETMRLQQMNAAVGDIQASSLPDEQKQAAILQLKTGIDSYKQRLQASQAKDTEMQANQRAAEAAKITKEGVEAEKFWASSAQDRTKPVYSQPILAEVDAELTKLQEEGKVGPLTPQERDQMVKEEAAKRDGGLLGHEIRHAPGKTEFVPHGKTDAGAGVAKGKAAAGKEEHPTGLSAAEYRKEYTQTARRVEQLSDKDPNGRWSRERIAEEIAKDMVDIHHLPPNFEEYHKLTPKGDQAATRQAWGGKFADQTPKPQPTMPASQREENKPTAAFQTSFEQLNARQDLPPEVKGPVIQQLAVARTLLVKSGGLKNLSADEKQLVMQAAAAYEQLPKPAPPQPAPVRHPQRTTNPFNVGMLRHLNPFG